MQILNAAGCIIVFVVTTTIMAEQIAGDLPHFVSADKSPYHVVADIYVPSGKTVEIEPGTVFLFNSFTGLHIRGVLNARGSLLKDIVFTSVNDNEYNENSSLNPTPYDWNGIYIHNDGLGTDLEKVKICYSVKGILSETKFIRISEALFHENGRANLTIEGEAKPVTQDMPYSYNLSMKDAVVDGVPVRILMDPRSSTRNITRYTGLLFIAGGAGVAGYYTKETIEDLKDLKEKSVKVSPDISEKNLRYLAGDPHEWEKAKDRKDTSVRRMVAGYAALLLGLTAFTVSFMF
ncbi:MAG: hypothetical protein JW915_20555 [Chitinispirillaceae bacterium]|nr:hypothetical protein [Chitinispirillaceae bacterium]